MHNNLGIEKDRILYVFRILYVRQKRTNTICFHLYVESKKQKKKEEEEEQKNKYSKEKQTHRYRGQTNAYQKEEEWGRGKIDEGN